MGAAAILLALLAAAPAAAAPKAKAEKTDPDPAVRARIAALVLRRVDFGSVSIIPVRFEDSRIAGPFEEGGRTIYCVSTRMLGRSFGKAERARAIVRVEQDAQGRRLRAEAYDSDVCSGERSKPFPELDGTPVR